MINKDVLYNNINEGIIQERLETFEKNLSKNLSLIKKYGGLRPILPYFEGKHVIVIGAGPSLENNFNLLKKYQYRNEIILVAADMALRPLIKHGIEPGYVFSCETTPVDYFGNIKTNSMHLLAFSCMSHINLRRWKGKISFYNWMMNEPEYDNLWERAGIDLGFIATGNIITTQAISFALGCNIKSLVIVGNDLGFNNRYYVKESIVHLNKTYSINRFINVDSFEIELSHKRKEYEIRRENKIFYTNHQFLAAKLWLEELFSKIQRQIYDCSIPGCSDKYTTKIDLKDFFSLFERKKKGKKK